MSSTTPAGGDPARVDVVGTEVPGARWRPHVGAETLDLLRHMEDLDDATRDRVCREAVAVLGRALPPAAPDGAETGLVVGHVQSGKTMSFTTVSALARDNGYPLIIVITGTSVPLSSQSTSRLLRDLRLETRLDRRWQHFHNPRVRPGHELQAIQAKLSEWRDPRTPPGARRTVLVTVMKNHRHLTQLNGVLQRLDLRGTPVLVIDDEADQAGLNNLVNQGQQSTTYRCLLGLRGLLPHHTYLQYTATPQAPLLINVIDALSPGFAQVLTPGPDYVGGREFFVSHPRLVRTIPASDIVTRNNPQAAPPDSLLEALRIFFLGVAAAWVDDDVAGNRSMMIHPSQHRVLHGDYYRWVSQVKAHWRQLLDRPESDPDRRELVDDLRPAYDDLRSTVPDLRSFEELLGALSGAIHQTMVWQLNTSAGRTPEVDWRSDYSHILVGGQAMDRGFTVNGLTVTYMPRGVGTSVADTIQQRARFFGYKRRYLGYCRIYLDGAVRAAYQRYVEHEEDVRARLEEHSTSGLPLSDWKRAFFLSQSLRPTRQSVMNLTYVQSVFSDRWFTPNAPHDSQQAVVANRQVVSSFVDGLTLDDDPGGGRRSKVMKHGMADVPLAHVFDALLTRLRVSRNDDSMAYTGLLLQIREYLDGSPDASCRVYQMSRGAERERSLTEADSILNLYQGADPADGSVYPGDREIKAPSGLTVQIHRLRLTRDKTVVAEDVLTVAIWVPASMARRGAWVVQETPD